MYKEILEKANYCESCVTKPCQVGCPLHNDTTGFIKLIKEEKFKQAYELLCKTTVLQPICGRICPHLKQCQGSCVKGVSMVPVEIGKMEAFLGDMAIKEGWEIPKISDKLKGKKIAVVGGGPAGLTCAAFLAKEGASVTIYEKYNYLGGIMKHGIPEFRLSKELLKNAVDKILELGIKTKLNMELGKDFTIEELQNKYDAVFLGFGSNVSSKMNIEGENLEGVFGGNELLEYNNHPNYKGKSVAVSGGGNVAMDTARTIKRLGAKNVYVIYRRAEEQMPAEKLEIEDAKKEGIEFLFQNNIVKIIGENKVDKIELIKTKLEKKEGETRLSPINIEGSNYLLDVDYVVMAVGSKVKEKLVNSLNLELTYNGKIKVDTNNKTSKEKIFAGGDVAAAKSTVAFAARSGRNAANNIKEFLLKKYSE